MNDRFSERGTCFFAFSGSRIAGKNDKVFFVEAGCGVIMLPVVSFTNGR